MRLERDWIVAHVPHQGRMCLLDAVLSWNSGSIECSARSHRAPDHPLRAHGRLGAACLIEYAAQAMAVHGALLQPPSAASAPFGMLASVRALELLVAELDSIAGELSIHAGRLHGDARGALYEFRVSSDARLLAHGRASVLLPAPAGSTHRTPA
jgi:predicted hotdog family 3-hydroxylacyl-ACP dehydratase